MKHTYSWIAALAGRLRVHTSKNASLWQQTHLPLEQEPLELIHAWGRCHPRCALVGFPVRFHGAARPVTAASLLPLLSFALARLSASGRSFAACVWEFTPWQCACPNCAWEPLRCACCDVAVLHVPTTHGVLLSHGLCTRVRTTSRQARAATPPPPEPPQPAADTPVRSPLPTGS